MDGLTSLFRMETLECVDWPEAIRAEFTPEKVGLGVGTKQLDFPRER